jgi:outer membrane protein TolC
MAGRPVHLGIAWGLALALLAGLAPVRAQQPRPAKLGAPELAPPEAAAGDVNKLPEPAEFTESPKNTLPISLPAAMKLANIRPLDIAVAQQQLAIAAAQLERAEWLWLPTLYLGGDYSRHDGTLQDVAGNILTTGKSSLMLGVGPSLVFATADALFAPLAARQDARAREAGVQAAHNDALLAVAESYFNVQQARGELAGAEVAMKYAAELVRRAEKLAPGLVPPVEAVRAQAELSRRKQALGTARERWRVSSADLGRVLRLDTTLPVEPVEPPFLQVTLLHLDVPVDDLVPLALTNRPELAARQAVVQATLERLRQEKLRPLMPSVLLRGFSTPVTGTLAAGYFGGGVNDRVGNFGGRADFDLQILWELQNLGFGNRAKIEEKRGEHQIAMLELFRTQDRIAAEVVQAHAQAQEAALRVREAEAGLKYAAESVQKNFEGLGQTRRAGEIVLLVVRPQEVLAAIQAFAQANVDFYAAIADYDRAQFRLYRALGHPAQALMHEPCAEPGREPADSPAR